MTDYLHRGPPLELKFSGAPGAVEGYAATFGGPPDDFGDIVMPNAFTSSLAEMKASGRPLPMLWSHDPGEPIGGWTSAAEDQRGLKVAGTLDDSVQRAREVRSLAMSGAVSGLSIGYRVKTAERDRAGNRLLKAVDLMEVSLVVVPANSRARLTSVKSTLGIERFQRKDIEQILLDAGCPRGLIKGVLAEGWRPSIADETAITEAKALADHLRARGAELRALTKGQRKWT
jgi:HK97 family phage prohead protease